MHKNTRNPFRTVSETTNYATLASVGATKFWPNFKWNQIFMDAKRACVCTLLDKSVHLSKNLQIFAHFCKGPLIFRYWMSQNTNKEPQHEDNKRPKKHPKMGKKSLKMTQTCGQNDLKMMLKSDQNDRNGTPKRQKIVRKSPQKEPKMSGYGIIRVRKWIETSMSTERSAQKPSRHS